MKDEARIAWCVESVRGRMVNLRTLFVCANSMPVARFASGIQSDSQAVQDGFEVVSGVFKSLSICFMMLSGVFESVSGCFVLLRGNFEMVSGVFESLSICFMTLIGLFESVSVCFMALRDGLEVPGDRFLTV